MGKKKFLDRISDALGLYDPDDPNRVLEEDEEESEDSERRTGGGSCGEGSKREKAWSFVPGSQE